MNLTHAAASCRPNVRTHIRKRVQNRANGLMSVILISALRVYDTKCSIAFVNNVRLFLSTATLRWIGEWFMCSDVVRFSGFLT
jgi:hypothetical protein